MRRQKRKHKFKVSPLEDTDLQLVLAINFLPGFLVGKLGSDSEKFRRLLRQRVDVTCVIHCSWLLNRNGRNMRRPLDTIDGDTFKTALNDLRIAVWRPKEITKKHNLKAQVDKDCNSE